MIFSYHRFIISTLLMLVVSTQAFGITVYDILQLSKKNYSDKEIIALMKATDSAFSLNAEDIAHLSELGVSEPVIQAMLKAVPSNETVTQTASGQHDSDPGDSKFNSNDVIIAIPAPADNLPPRADIVSERLQESGAGHHQHQVITLSGIRLFILRDEGSYSSLDERARAVVKRLSAASSEDGEFHPEHVAGSDAVIFTAAGSTQKTLIISVSKEDAHAYQRRSGRHISQDLLAAYWSDLLSDYWALAFGGQQPERLAKLHEGGALQDLYERLDKSDTAGEHRLSRAFQSLPKQEQDHLLKLAVSVPDDFIASEEHEAKTP